VRTVTISDHTADKLEQHRSNRLSVDQQALAAFDAAVAARRDRQVALGNTIVQAWRARRFGSWLFNLGKLLLLSLSPSPQRPKSTPVSAEETIWESGREGEVLVRSTLEAAFGDDWTLIAGYQNNRGEIDLILVGALGVFAMEVKFINGHIAVDGDRWTRDRYDRWGNLKDAGVPIGDRRGRSPSRQLNEPADKLEAFLRTGTSLRRVVRMVVLSHPRSVLASARNLTVDAVAPLSTLVDTVRTVGAPGTIECRRIVELIQQDHAFHRRKNGVPARPRPARPDYHGTA
jgi:hypothetical protein